MPCTPEYFDANIPPDINLPKGLRELLTHTTSSASPSGVVVPTRIGQWHYDDNGEDFYLSHGLTNTDWKQVTA